MLISREDWSNMECAQEMCSNWGGDGNVCLCALFNLDPSIPMDEEEERNGSDDLH